MKRARGFDAILKWLAWGMFLGSLAAGVSACGWLGGKAPAEYAEELMEDDIELEYRGDDAMALVEEVSDLFQCRETGWRLGRVMARQERDGLGGISYGSLYLFYKPEDGAETVYRRIRVLKKGGRWYVVEAFQQDMAHEYVYMDACMSGRMLEEIWELAEGQARSCFSEGDECEMNFTSNGLHIIIFEKEGKERRITGQYGFSIRETEAGYQLGETAEDIQIRTETEPIYNHFPDLPETSKMQWYGEASGGIGLNMVRVSVFAYYEHDITGELQGMRFVDCEDAVDLRFVPEGISREQRWRIAEDAPFAFQEGVKDTRKMNTTVYINEQGTVLYLEGIGE